MRSLIGRRKRLSAAVAAAILGVFGFAAVAIAGELVATGSELSTVTPNAGNAVEVEQGTSESFNFTVSQSGSNACDATSSAQVNRDYGLDASGDPVASSDPSSQMNWASPGTGQNCDVVATDAAANYQHTGNVSAHADTPPGTYYLRIDFVNITNSNTNQGKANDNTPDYVKVTVVAGQQQCLNPLAAAVLAPINSDDSSVFKQGSTIPVKVAVTDPCDDDAAVSGLTDLELKRSLTNGATPPPANEINESTTSQSAATTGSLFRETDVPGTYIFNLATSNIQAGDYWLGFKQGADLLGSVKIGLAATQVGKAKK